MAVKKKEAYFTSSDGFTGIHCSIWQDDAATPKALFQIAHGVSEHIGRYENFASFIAQQGFVVFGNDHLGHGQSVFNEEDYGFFAETDGDKRLVDDMHILSLIMKKRFPGLPLILFGHSMGSLCARVYASSFPDELKGLILCGTCELPASITALEAPMELLCRRLGAKTVVSSSIADRLLTIGVKNRQTIKDWLSLSQSNVNDYLNDPLCGKPLKLGGARDILSLASSCCSTTWAGRLPKDLSILIVSGAKDPIGLNGKGVTALCDNLDEADIKYEVRVYPGLRHEILNENDNEFVFDDILSWTEKLLAE